jgi:hypothetical protein
MINFTQLFLIYTQSVKKEQGTESEEKLEFLPCKF